MSDEAKSKTKSNIYSAEVKLISMGVVVLIVFLAFMNISGTLGWFSSNDTVTAGSMQVSIRDIKDFSVQLTSYSISAISGDNYTISDNESYVLPTLDPSGIVYSQYERALAVIITITAKTDTSASLSMKTIHNQVSFAQKNFISNCVKVSSATVNGNVATRSANTQSFVSTTDGVSKVSTLSLVDGLPMEAGEELTLCVIIEYNEKAIAALFEGARGQGNDFDQMSFTNDIAFVVERAD